MIIEFPLNEKRLSFGLYTCDGQDEFGNTYNTFNIGLLFLQLVFFKCKN